MTTLTVSFHVLRVTLSSCVCSRKTKDAHVIDLHIWKSYQYQAFREFFIRLTNFVYEEEEEIIFTFHPKIFNNFPTMSFLPGTASLVKEIDSKSYGVRVLRLRSIILFCFESLIRCTKFDLI